MMRSAKQNFLHDGNSADEPSMFAGPAGGEEKFFAEAGARIKFPIRFGLKGKQESSHQSVCRGAEMIKGLPGRARCGGGGGKLINSFHFAPEHAHPLHYVSFRRKSALFCHVSPANGLALGRNFIANSISTYVISRQSPST
jgi:hypothetical protein